MFAILSCVFTLLSFPYSALRLLSGGGRCVDTEPHPDRCRCRSRRPARRRRRPRRLRQVQVVQVSFAMLVHS